MKLTGVTVNFAPEAVVQWEDGIRAYATARSIPDDEIATATNSPEGKAYVRNMLAPRIKAGVERALAGQLNGARPVRLGGTVKNFAIATAGRTKPSRGGARRVARPPLGGAADA